jgi:hypothetical protein
MTNSIDLTPVEQVDIKVDEDQCEVSLYWTEDNPKEEGDNVTLFCTDAEGDQTTIVLEQGELFRVIMAACRFLRADLPK